MLQRKQYFENGSLSRKQMTQQENETYPVFDKIYRAIDFRELGLTTPAKNQGDCGSCTVFGIVAQLENALLLDREFYNTSKF